MNFAPIVLICPLDGLPLATNGAMRHCPSGHTFDTAREGYCNLLPVQYKASTDPGDSKAMVSARHRLLEAGHFAPIADAVSTIVIERIAHKPIDNLVTIFDAGCGEGYYLDQLLRQIAASQPPSPSVALAGIDISKWAIRQAARRSPAITWVVASNRRPPFAAASVDIILCLFGFPSWDGFSAVQGHGSNVVLVDPAPDHLLELREIIYPTVTRQPLALFTVAATAAGYHVASEHVVRFTAHLPTPETIQDLLTMTPHAHRITEAGRAKLAGYQTLDVTVDVVLRVAVKRAP